MRAFVLLSLSLSLAACEFSGGTGKLTPAPRITCDGARDPLQTDAGGDEYDCLVLASVATYMHPDAMLIKAQIAQESAFNPDSISGDSPCGIPVGWTDPEAKSFGLTQVTPACNEASTLLLPDGHPNLATDEKSDLWVNSVFNPTANIDEGVRTTVNFLNGVKKAWPGCTDAEYALMSAGAFNSGPRSVLGCNMYNARAAMYVTSVLGHYSIFASRAGWPNPY